MMNSEREGECQVLCILGRSAPRHSMRRVSVPRSLHSCRMQVSFPQQEHTFSAAFSLHLLRSSGASAMWTNMQHRILHEMLVRIKILDNKRCFSKRLTTPLSAHHRPAAIISSVLARVLSARLAISRHILRFRSNQLRYPIPESVVS